MFFTYSNVRVAGDYGVSRTIQALNKCCTKKKGEIMAQLSRNSSAEFLKLPDCLWLLESDKCRWLQISECAGENCAHYRKPSSQAKAKARLRSLDEETQARIAQKYYGGFRTWMATTENPWS